MGDLIFNGGGLGSFGGPPTPPGPHPFGPLDAGLGGFNGSLGASAMPGTAAMIDVCKSCEVGCVATLFFNLLGRAFAVQWLRRLQGLVLLDKLLVPMAIW